MSDAHLITSASNPKVKWMRKLARDRKERQRSGMCLVEGLRLVTEAVQLAAPIESLVVCPEILQSAHGRSLVSAQHYKGTPILFVSVEAFKSISAKDGPQGIAAIVRQNWYSLDELQVANNRRWVALDSVADPGNLGTILRTNDAVGGEGVLVLDQATDPYEMTALRASMGAVFSQKLTRATFESFLDWKRANGLPLIGASGQGSVDYRQVTYPDSMVLLMGSERHGLAEQHLRACDEIVRIPMVGRSDSLNLAVATAVILYEIFAQQRGNRK